MCAAAAEMKKQLLAERFETSQAASRQVTNGKKYVKVIKPKPAAAMVEMNEKL